MAWAGRGRTGTRRGRGPLTAGASDADHRALGYIAASGLGNLKP